jgi:hypothetical protein
MHRRRTLAALAALTLVGTASAGLSASPATASEPVTGTRTALVVFVEWLATPGTGDAGAKLDMTLDQARERVNTANNPWFHDVSGGLFDGFVTDFGGPVLIVAPPFDQDRYGFCGSAFVETLSSRADAAIRERGIEPSSYSTVIYKFGGQLRHCGWNGKYVARASGSSRPDRVFINGFAEFGMGRVLVHELGHSFGLGHADVLQCQDANGAPVPLSDTCTPSEAVDRFSVMGAGYGAFSAPMLHQLGWNDGHLQELTAGDWTQQFTLSPLTAGPGLQAISLTDHSTKLWIEYRPQTGIEPLSGDPSFYEPGVQIRVALGDQPARLISFKPGTYDEFSDPGLPVGQTFTVPFGGPNITVNAIGDAGATITIASTFKAVPNVKGLSLDEAKATLADAGFAVSEVFYAQDRTCRYIDEQVMAQSPSGGTRVRPGSGVVVTLGTYPTATGCR